MYTWYCSDLPISQVLLSSPSARMRTTSYAARGASELIDYRVHAYYTVTKTTLVIEWGMSSPTYGSVATYQDHRWSSRIPPADEVLSSTRRGFLTQAARPRHTCWLWCATLIYADRSQDFCWPRSQFLRRFVFQNSSSRAPLRSRSSWLTWIFWLEQEIDRVSWLSHGALYSFSCRVLIWISRSRRSTVSWLSHEVLYACRVLIWISRSPGPRPDHVITDDIGRLRI